MKTPQKFGVFGIIKPLFVNFQKQIDSVVEGYFQWPSAKAETYIEDSYQDY